MSSPVWCWLWLEKKNLKQVRLHHFFQKSAKCQGFLAVLGIIHPFVDGLS